MLSVDPPDNAAHSWREFFIHIATIVVGLLIALSLEQTVEYIHRRHELKETREALRQERTRNYKVIAADTARFRALKQIVKNDFIVLAYLKKHPGTPEDKLPGVLYYTARYLAPIQSAWKDALTTNNTDLMPRNEVAETASLYQYFDKFNGYEEEVWLAAGKANEYLAVDPDPSHFSPAQLEQQIQRTQNYGIAIYRFGAVLESIHNDHGDFPPGPTKDELAEVRGGVRSAAEKARLAAAMNITANRLQPSLQAANAAERAAATP